MAGCAVLQKTPHPSGFPGSRSLKACGGCAWLPGRITGPDQGGRISVCPAGYKNAYSLAGRATRLFFSRMQGVPWEFTNAELEKVLAAAGPGTDSAGIMAVLDRCSDVAFARGTPDASEFAAMIEKIRGRVSSGSNIRAGKEVPKVRPDTGQ